MLLTATVVLASGTTALASPRITLYFHALAPFGPADNALPGGSTMDSTPPSDAVPAVSHGTPLVVGVNTETIWDASWQSTSPVTLAGERVTFVWWVVSANQGLTPSSWRIEIWQRFSLTSLTKLATSTVTFDPVASEAPVELRATLPSVTTNSYGSITPFSSIVALIDAADTGEAAHVILYDSGDFPSRIEVRPQNQAPVADIDAPMCAKKNHDVAFDGTGSDDPDGAVVSWEWDFGDGSTGSGATAVHSYSFDGPSQNFTVTLTVTDDEGAMGSTTHAIQIAAPGLCP